MHLLAEICVVLSVPGRKEISVGRERHRQRFHGAVGTNPGDGYGHHGVEHARKVDDVVDPRLEQYLVVARQLLVQRLHRQAARVGSAGRPGEGVGVGVGVGASAAAGRYGPVN